MLDELVAADDASAIFEEVREQFQNLRLAREQLTVPAQLVLLAI